MTTLKEIIDKIKEAQYLRKTGRWSEYIYFWEMDKLVKELDEWVEVNHG